MNWFYLYMEFWITGILVSLLISAFLVYLSIKAHRRKITTGEEGIIGETGVFKGDDIILIRGEIWQIENPENLENGDRVRVIGVEKLILKVVKF